MIDCLNLRVLYPLCSLPALSCVCVVVSHVACAGSGSGGGLQSLQKISNLDDFLTGLQDVIPTSPTPSPVSGAASPSVPTVASASTGSATSEQQQIR